MKRVVGINQNSEAANYKSKTIRCIKSVGANFSVDSHATLAS